MATLATTDLTEHLHARPRPAVGILGDDVSLRRLEASMPESCQVVAKAQTVDRLLDGERVPFQVAVLAGGGELLARGGPVEALRSLRPACSIVVVATTEDTGLIR